MTDDHLISLQPGTVIGGKYEVVKCLGSGSMGLVYACRHRELQGQLVAVKVLFPEVAQDKVAAARFRNEILASYGVSHPNVVRAYEYLRDGDLVAYTMEYVGGGDLAERLSRQERIAIPEFIRLLSQMAAGVQAIHDAGIVHRDLKPENILLTKEGSVKIADFGIARNRHGPKLTEHGGVVGTIDYVAPEYMLRSQVDWRSDIYALGILAYEMVTGESPFRGDSVYATMTKRLKTDPEPPSKYRPECPAELDAVILKAMQREPEARYQSAMEIFFDLQKIATDKGMRTAAAGGLFISNQGGAPAYVGPSVQQVPDELSVQPSATVGAVAASQSQVSANGAVNAFGVGGSEVDVWDDAPRAAAGYRPGAKVHADPGPAYASGGSFEEDAGAPTQVLSKQSVLLATELAEAETTPPIRSHKVLQPPGDLVSDGWEPIEPRARAGRVRELSHRYQGPNSRRSYWLEAVAAIVAMVVGVGFGCLVLKLFAPSLLESIPFLKG